MAPPILSLFLTIRPSPATINYAIVANSTDQVSSPVINTATVGKLKITIANNVSDKEMRLKANDDWNIWNCYGTLTYISRRKN